MFFIPPDTPFVLNPPPPPQHEFVSTLKAKITMIFKIMIKKTKIHPWNKPKLYCEAPVSSSTGRTENRYTIAQ